MIILIGDKDSKRTKYFLKAAEKHGVSVRLISWTEIFKGFDYRVLEGAAVKIDPPSYKITELGMMQESLLIYQDILKDLALCKCTFLNTPEAILNVLDKRAAKKELGKHMLPVTRIVSENVNSASQLIGIMREKKEYSVFIKPVNYSGAAGIAAFRLNPASGRMKLYTSCCIDKGKLYNTKKLYVLDNSTDILNIINSLAVMGGLHNTQGLIAEKWYPKDSFNGKSYDLRVVYQYGRVSYIVVRQSDGPVTNLHLNNQAMDFRKLMLPGNIISGIEEICSKAVHVFKGLNVAGIDVLLDKGSRKPRIIEINGQGDLIYQDIFSVNKIYSEQVEMLSGKA